MPRLPRRTAKRIFHIVENLSDRAKSALIESVYPGRGTRLPAILLIAQPKSGSTFMHRALKGSLQVPFMQVGVSGVYDVTMNFKMMKQFAKGNVVSRTHLPARRFLVDALSGIGVKRIVLHVRNPESSIISWTRAIDRFIEQRGMPGATLACETLLPPEYDGWQFEDRLRWQIRNYLPRQVQWIEEWLSLVSARTDTQFLITRYEDFSADPRACIGSILTFYGIEWHDDWIKLPRESIGLNNIYSDKKIDKWAGLDPELKALAAATVPATLRAHFSW